MSSKKITLQENNGSHIYQSNGKNYPSVTTILDIVSYNKYLMKWANYLGFKRKNYEDELKKSAQLGTYLHAAAQNFVDPENGIYPNIPDPLVDYYVRKRMEALKFRLNEEKDWSTLFTEKSFVSEELGIAGTIDWGCMFHNKRTLFDFKSAKQVREKFVMQLGGYYGILKDNNIEIDQGGIILCREDRAIIRLFPKEVLEIAQKAFMDVKAYYDEHEMLTEFTKNKKYLLNTPVV